MGSQEYERHSLYFYCEYKKVRQRMPNEDLRLDGGDDLFLWFGVR